MAKGNRRQVAGEVDANLENVEQVVNHNEQPVIQEVERGANEMNPPNDDAEAAAAAARDAEAAAAAARDAAAAAAAAAGGGNGPGVAPGGMEALMGMLAQVLARVPGVGAAPQRDPVLDAVAGGAHPLPSQLSMLEHMRKMGTKYYSGGNDLMEAEEWRSRLERNFQAIRCPEQYKKDIVVHHLEGDAHLWWRGVSSRMEDPVDCTWETFCDEFRAKYFPEEAFDRLNAEFLELQQGTMSVREYEAKFNKLKVFAGRDYETEKAQVRRFLRGLKLEIRNRCLVRNYDTVTELVEKAALVEEGLNEEAELAGDKLKSQIVSQFKKSGNAGGQKKGWVKGSNSGKQFGGRSACPTCGKMHQGPCRSASGACHRCGSMGHKVRDCPEEDTRGKDQGRDVSTKVCYNCGEVGHIRPNCPKMGQQQTGKRGNDGSAPPAKRQNVAPRVYTAEATLEASTSRPITG